jgi:hypothetical protein
MRLRSPVKFFEEGADLLPVFLPTSSQLPLREFPLFRFFRFISLDSSKLILLFVSQQSKPSTNSVNLTTYNTSMSLMLATVYQHAIQGGNFPIFGINLSCVLYKGRAMFLLETAATF